MSDIQIKKIIYDFREQIEFYHFSDNVYISRKLLKKVYFLIMNLYKQRNYYKNKVV